MLFLNYPRSILQLHISLALALNATLTPNYPCSCLFLPNHCWCHFKTHLNCFLCSWIFPQQKYQIFKSSKCKVDVFKISQHLIMPKLTFIHMKMTGIIASIKLIVSDAHYFKHILDKCCFIVMETIFWDQVIKQPLSQIGNLSSWNVLSSLITFSFSCFSTCHFYFISPHCFPF